MLVISEETTLIGRVYAAADEIVQVERLAMVVVIGSEQRRGCWLVGDGVVFPRHHFNNGDGCMADKRRKTGSSHVRPWL